MPNNRVIKMSKVKQSEKAHPYSRKAVQMRRAMNREDKLAKNKSASDVKKTRAVERMLWFKYALDEELTAATKEQVHDIIGQYINRYDLEIAELTENMRKGRPPPARLELLKTLRSKDIQEYNTGIEVPQMMHPKNVVALRKWEGDYNGIGEIKTVVVRKADGASAPPADPISKLTGMDVDA
ncbi:translation machinery-associated protein 16 [Fimicolochytrium jonesii]|uniref:translation machinery-associated protein 16 n=1 Tax=Fimicolochytrium jonesii TaxID=1396493 RepID=UPI0022FE075C|nr:translation machinery-associated protein 16 [Fimicolochytrium jonesii]KAI8817951.1 translation machinery-associated protein 16 [Fimicolochytrium jonesii]